MTFLLYLCAKKNSNMSQEKVILVTNDDGITAKGISALVEVARQFGRVVVVAPDKAQSAMGHAITLNQPLRLNKVDIWKASSHMLVQARRLIV